VSKYLRLRQAKAISNLQELFRQAFWLHARLSSHQESPPDRKAAQRYLPVFRLYDLRHTHATLLLSNGENPKVASERLGHSTIVLTLDTYSHVLPDMQEEAARRIEKVLFGHARG
jgi:integrase